MEVNEILEEFRYNRGRLPREAILAAIEKRDEIIPHPLRTIEETTARAEELAEHETYMAHFYALYLLAQFREKRAYPRIARLFSLPGDVCDRLTRDFTTESLACFGELLREKLDWDLESPDGELLTFVVYHACDLSPREIYEDIERAYEGGLVWEGFVDLESVQGHVRRGEEASLKALPERYSFIKVTAALRCHEGHRATAGFSAHSARFFSRSGLPRDLG